MQNLHPAFRNAYFAFLVTISFEEIRDFFTMLSKALNPTAEITLEVLVAWLGGRKRQNIMDV